MFSQHPRAFQQPRPATLLILEFASGLPFALTSSILQAWMTAENIDLKTIGFFSLVGQAYVFKFLWSPLIDRYTLPFSGRHHGWLLAAQVLLLTSIVTMGFLEPGAQLRRMAALAAVIASRSASRDIVFDAWKTDVLPVEEYGIGAAISVLGYRLGMLVSDGLALWIADRWLGWQGMYWLMAALLTLCIIATLLAPEPTGTVPASKTLEQAAAAPPRDFLSRNNTWLIPLLIVLYRLGGAFAMSLTTTFLIRGVGFDADEVGVVNKTPGLLATIADTLYGGIPMQRPLLFRALLIFDTLQGASNASYWLLSATDKHMFSMAAAVSFGNLCGGMGTATFVALLMTLRNKSFSATQFALLSALSAVGRVYVDPVTGWFVEAHGQSTFYLFSVLTAVPGLILLPVCRQTLERSWQDESFIPRAESHGAYSLALMTLVVGCRLLPVQLLLLTINAMDYTNLSFLPELLEVSVMVAVCGVVFGGLLDYLILHKTHLA